MEDCKNEVIKNNKENSILFMKKRRQSNIELLRITSMLLVLIVHANFKVLGAPNNDNISIDLFGSIMRYLTESLSIVCVNAFVLISSEF